MQPGMTRRARGFFSIPKPQAAGSGRFSRTAMLIARSCAKRAPQTDERRPSATIHIQALTNTISLRLRAIAQCVQLRQIPVNEKVAETVPGAGLFGEPIKGKRTQALQTFLLGLLWLRCVSIDLAASGTRAG